ncbi:MAG: hypothetical protein J5973_00625, partial [Eubacterium sp.]|nr:hypothetical protein [Eubacterium sp.]
MQPAADPDAAGSADAAQTETDPTAESQNAADAAPFVSAVSPLVYNGDGYTVKVNFTEDAMIPEGAYLVAQPVPEDHADYEEYKSRALSVVEAMDENNAAAAEGTGAAATPEKNSTLLGLFDLTIYDAAGQAIEPQAPVTVTASVVGAADAAASEIYAVHFVGSGAVNGEGTAAGTDTVIDPEHIFDTIADEAVPLAGPDPAAEPVPNVMPAVESVPADQAQIEVIAAGAAGEEVVFETVSFSVYALVATTTIETTVLASDGFNYRISVTCGPEAGIPEGAGLAVTELAGEVYEEYLGKAAVAMDAAGFAYARIFDISIVDGAGQKIQPAAPVEVVVELLDGDVAAGDFSVVHFAGAEEIPEEIAVADTGIEAGAGTEAQSSETTTLITSDGAEISVAGSGCSLAFETDSFSAYAIVQGPAAIPIGWVRLSSIDQLKAAAQAETGLYIGTSAGRYLTNQIGTNDKSAANGIVKSSPAQSYPDTARAVPYYFEAVEGTSNQFYVYWLDGENGRHYVKNTNTDDLTFTTSEAEKTPFTVTINNNLASTIYTDFGSTRRSWNEWEGAGNRIIAAYNNGGSALYLWQYLENPEDPYDLDGKSFGLMNWYDGTTGKALMSSANETEGHLNGLALTVMSKVKNGAKLYVPDNSDISFWTFHFVENDIYQLSSVVDGSTKYLRISGDGLSMVSTPDEACNIKVVPGTGSHAGMICLQAGNATLAYSGKIDQGFQTGGATGNEWLYLTEESELDKTYFMTYSASKVSVSDPSVTNGSNVIVYTRVWNDETKRYEFYAVDHDGSLVRCYESGDSIEWVSGRLNSMLWSFTEYYWEGTTDPNYYYELYNQYSEKFMAPQKSNGQILSDSPIGINLNGRRNGQYYSPVVAWDDGYYAYAGLKADKASGKIVSCPLAEADDFYFAIVQDIPVDDELTTVPTVDHQQYGITMKMINFGTDLYKGNNNDAVRKSMSNFLGSDNAYHNGNTEPGLLATKLGEDGYPVTKANNSLADWFSARPEVNHLFIQSTYSGTGYFEYDSIQNFAHLNESTNTFEVYKELAASASSGQFHDHGHFWPYNMIEAGKFASNKNTRNALGGVLPESDPRKYEKLYAVQKSNTNFAPDYYLGMEVTASFTQTPNGLDDWGHDIIYEFTGDDDFWLFVDGELIIDLGGVHDALAGTVNYRTGQVYVNGTNTSLRQLFESNYRGRNPRASDAEVQAYLDEIFDGEIFKDYTTHTMKIYYLERGAGASNLHMRFNLASIKPGTAQLTKHLSGVDTMETVLAEFPYQILYRTKNTATGVTSEHYLTNAVPADSSRTEDYVFYKDMTVPVTYKTSHTVAGKTYNDVFILKPEETADIHFPVDTSTEDEEFLDYRIIECGVNTEVYTGVTVN